MRVTEEYQARSRAVSKVTGEIAAQLELVSANGICEGRSRSRDSMVGG
jgi:hypothetical protein